MTSNNILVETRLGDDKGTKKERGVVVEGSIKMFCDDTNDKKNNKNDYSTTDTSSTAADHHPPARQRPSQLNEDDEEEEEEEEEEETHPSLSSAKVADADIIEQATADEEEEYDDDDEEEDSLMSLSESEGCSGGTGRDTATDTEEHEEKVQDMMKLKSGAFEFVPANYNYSVFHRKAINFNNSLREQLENPRKIEEISLSRVKEDLLNYKALMLKDERLAMLNVKAIHLKNNLMITMDVQKREQQQQQQQPIVIFEIHCLKCRFKETTGKIRFCYGDRRRITTSSEEGELWCMGFMDKTQCPDCYSKSGKDDRVISQESTSFLTTSFILGLLCVSIYIGFISRIACKYF